MLHLIPKFQLLDNTLFHLTLNISQSDVSIVNGIRRIILSEFPCVAIEQVIIEENSSDILDEILVHKIAFISFELNLDIINKFEYCKDCNCNITCEKCCIEFLLDESCGENEIVKKITTEHLKPVNHTIEYFKFFKDKSNFLPLLYLKKNQKIKLKCVAVKGKPNQHAKWSSVSSCSYQIQPNFEFDRNIEENLSIEKRKFIVESCKRNVFKLNENNIIDIENIMNCNFCNDCIQFCDKSKETKELIHLTNSNSNFTFKIESRGSLSSQEIFLQGVMIFQEKIEKLISYFKKN